VLNGLILSLYHIDHLNLKNNKNNQIIFTAGGDTTGIFNIVTVLHLYCRKKNQSSFNQCSFLLLVVQKRRKRHFIDAAIEYYYDGDCTNETTKQEIARNFIKALQSNDHYKDLCSTDCSASNVQV
jgi:GTPase Era involved in 16S rRNA processing